MAIIALSFLRSADHHDPMIAQTAMTKKSLGGIAQLKRSPFRNTQARFLLPTLLDHIVMYGQGNCGRLAGSPFVMIRAVMTSFW